MVGISRVNRVGFLAALAAAAALAAPSLAPAAPTPLAEFGAEGPGAGQLDDPQGVVVEPGTGDIYVADFSNNRVSVFGPAGDFIHAFGRDVAPPDGGTGLEVCTAGTGCIQGDGTGSAGSLALPIGFAFDASGGLYVLEFGGNRVSLFDPDGPTFIRAFGWGARTGAPALETCTAVSGCVASPTGGGPGQLSAPWGLALDGSLLYVGDTFNNRVSAFDVNGPVFVRSFGGDVAEPDGGTGFETCPDDGACRAGDAGGDAGQLDAPRGLLIDAGGRLYVVEGGSRVDVFDVSNQLAPPTFVRAFGRDAAEPDGGAAFEVCPAQGACRGADPGASAGALNTPTDVALDAGGNLYVAENGNSRVSVFGTAGPSFIHAFGWGVDTGANAFEVCTAMSLCQFGSTGGAGSFSVPAGIAFDCRGAFWVADSSLHRLQRFGEPGTPAAPCTAGEPPKTQPQVQPAKKKKKCRKPKRRSAESAKKKCKKPSRRTQPG